ncbi:thioesterase domain-containing protein [Seonamhaeicola marinus]|uniref:Carrier domain-containing protein n=1 Tax=Seonamhaeicola marinus TaxID=1912246 RepID=A0A5D0HTJ0_9FLAO|nr:thioesterase domain-containing protein [Seonamhaeicola marinus]TYA74713.1 hypothetical protein FUA24_15485 [Seonamhaeicola marinus]
MTQKELIQKYQQLSDEEKYRLKLNILALKRANELTSNRSKVKLLNAYIKSKNQINFTDFKLYLRNKLPSYMIPSNIFELQDIPRLPNGKIDLNNLKSNLKVSYKGYEDKVPQDIDLPQNDTEKLLVKLWQDVLGISQISVSDNFFEIGGDSILSIQLVSKARKSGLNLRPNQLFENQTIRAMSKAILNSSTNNESEGFLTTIRKEGHKNPLFCIHSGGGHVFFYGPLKDHLKKGRPIYALNPAGLNSDEEMHENVEDMAADYLKTIKKMQSKGPYNILVYCFSTSVGNEISYLLKRSGEQVNIIVIDTMASAWNATDNETLMVRIKFFFKRFFLSPFKTLKHFFQERYYLIEPILVKLFGKTHEKELEKLKANLRKMSVDYKFKRHSGDVSLILTHKEDKRFEDFTIQSWKNLTSGNVNVTYTKGHHNTLFEASDIKYVSEKIDQVFVE